MKRIFLYLLAAGYIGAGINHFVSPDFYLPMMPNYIPWHRFWIYFTGVAEVAGGVGLLLPKFRRAAAWGIIALLVCLLPAHIHMLQYPEPFDVPYWALIVRLPVQALFIAYAYVYTRPD